MTYTIDEIYDLSYMVTYNKKTGEEIDYTLFTPLRLQ